MGGVAERREQVAFRTGAAFHQGKAGRGMGDEDVDESVTAPGTEPLELRGEIDEPLPGGVDLDLGRVHAPPVCRVGTPRGDGRDRPHHFRIAGGTDTGDERDQGGGATAR